MARPPCNVGSSELLERLAVRSLQQLLRLGNSAPPEAATTCRHMRTCRRRMTLARSRRTRQDLGEKRPCFRVGQASRVSRVKGQSRLEPRSQSWIDPFWCPPGGWPKGTGWFRARIWEWKAFDQRRRPRLKLDLGAAVDKAAWATESPASPPSVEVSL